MKRLWHRLDDFFLETMNTLTHLFGTAIALMGGGVLLFLSWGEWRKMLALAVYSASMVVLYLASTLLHGAKLPEKQRMWLNRLDHAAIFLLIAGTYTPIIVFFFSDVWRWPALIFIWSAAGLGIFFKMTAMRIHGFLNASIYPVLGWGGAVPAIFAYQSRTFLPVGGLLLLFAGGLIYTLGFIIYYRRQPDPWPGFFGHHEIWHLFVMGGSLCHYLVMLFYVVPAPAIS